MAVTENNYTGDGSTTSYALTFQYVDDDDIKVSLDGTLTTAYSLANATTVLFNAAPANGVAVRIYRDTNTDNLKTTFFAGSAIRSQDLNDNFQQNNFAVQEIKNNTWDNEIDTIHSDEAWVSDDTKIATTAAMDQRFQDEVNDTLTKAELAALSDVIPDNDDAVPTTGAVKDYVDHVIETDILVDGTGLNKTGSSGQVTLGISANSVDFDRIKDSDIITDAEQDAGSPAPGNTNIFTALGAARRFDTIVSQAEQSTAVSWEVGKTWLQNDSEKTVRIWDGSAWVAVASGGAFTTLPKVVYVDAVNGDDNLEGHRISNPKRTIKAAIEQINAETDEVGDGSVVIVAPGVYQETAPIDIKKKNVSIIGQALRSCIVHPTSATEENTLFRLNSGSYIANLTLTGVKASGARGGNALDTNATHGLPTNQGWNFAFFPNATIVKSPYIANCTNFSDSEIDNDDLNAFNPRGGLGGDTDSAPTGGGILIDGSVVNSNSPLRSMVCDSYTHVGLDGPGIFVTNNGYCQATSSYAFFTHYHIKTLNGGQANLAASTSDFGRFGLIAEGRSSSAIFSASTTANANSGATTFTINAPTAAAGWHGSATRPQANMVVDVGGNTYSIISATANGTGWDVEISRPNPDNLSDNLGLNGAVNSGSAVSFFLRSMIASSGHTMEYVGSGTNYSALPENGGVPVEANEIVEVSDGKVWAATTNHQGKFTVGPTFNVDQVTGYVNIANGAIGIEQLIENLDLNSFTLSDSTGDVTIDDQLDMNTHKIVNVVDPTGAQDAATKAYADTKLPLAGGTMTGNIVMSGSETVDGRDLSVDGAKLDGIESGADVTDATNVDAAGAVMNSDTTTASMSFVVDEDAMTSDSDTKVPTQQSVKAYADTKLPLAGGTMTGDLTMNAQSDVKFADSDSSNWVAVQAPATIGTNYTLTLPNSVGNAGEALITDAGGNLSWSSSVSTVVDQIIEGDTKVEAVDTGTDGEIQFTTDGTRAMTIDNSQRVGIGTSSPAHRLSISEASGTQSALGLTSGVSTLIIGSQDVGSGRSAISYSNNAGGSNNILSLGFGAVTSGAPANPVINLTQAGNVGIGTTSPDDYLTIGNTAISGDIGLRFKGDASSRQFIMFGDPGGAQLGDIMYDHGTNAMRFRTNNNERARIDSSGRLLVGTSSSVPVLSASTGAAVQVNSNNHGAYAQTWFYGANNQSGAAIMLAKSRNTTYGSYTAVQSGDSLGGLYWAGDDGSDLNNQAASILCWVDGTPGTDDMPGRLVFSTTEDGNSSPTERMRITSAGNVGIGTTSPNARLEVSQNSTYDSESTAGIAIKDGTSDVGLLLGADATNDIAYIQSLDPGTAYGTRPLAINPNGANVGIGTSAVDAKFHIAADSSDGTQARITGATNQNYQLRWGFDTTNLVGRIQSIHAGTAYKALSLNPDGGNVGIGTTSPDHLLDLSAGTNLNLSITQLTHNLFANEGIGLTFSRTSSDSDLMAVGVVDTDKLGIFGREGIIFGTGGGSTYSATTESARIDSSGRLLVGTSSSPSSGDGQYSLLVVDGNTSDASGSGELSLQRGQAATAMANSAGVGGINFTDNSGNTFAVIRSNVDGTTAANDYPGRLSFWTTADGASSPTERLRIAQSGAFGLSGANYGTNGQVLTSQGSGSAPQWATPSGLTWTTYQQNAASTTVLLSNIPSTAEQIIIAYNELSSASTADQTLYLGDSGGIETTGYYFTYGYGGFSNGGTVVQNGSSGFLNGAWNNSSNVYWGTIFLTKAGGNFWNIFWRFNEQSSASHGFVYGGKATSSTLTQVRFMPSSGNWDAGQVRFKYLA